MGAGINILKTHFLCQWGGLANDQKYFSYPSPALDCCKHVKWCIQSAICVFWGQSPRPTKTLRPALA